MFYVANLLHEAKYFQTEHVHTAVELEQVWSCQQNPTVGVAIGLDVSESHLQVWVQCCCFHLKSLNADQCNERPEEADFTG